MALLEAEAKKYWNPLMERLPREHLRALQLRKFKKIFEWAYERSKFHRRLYQEAGLEPGDIKTYEDIQKVPRVEKSMMRSIQRKDPFPLRGGPLRSPGRGGRISADQRHHRSTGVSTGYLAGLGVVVRVLGLYPLCPGVSKDRPGLPSLWV